MSQRESIIDARELFGDLFHVTRLSDLEDGFEACWHWPRAMGSGSMNLVKLRPGLLLGVGNYRVKEDVAVRFNADYAPVSMEFSVSGSMRSTLYHEGGRNELWHFKDGHSVLNYVPRWRGVTRVAADVPVTCVGLSMDPSVLAGFMDGLDDRMPQGIRDAMDNRVQAPYSLLSGMTPAVRAVVYQILDCPYLQPSRLKRLYLEGKVLELMAHSLARMAPVPAETNPKHRLRPRDMACASRARNLVRRDLQDPPRLKDLARAVGMSHPKLNYCFREMFGTTIYGYLRQLRLDRARTLLGEGRMNVTEVAVEVGYSSPSHFTKAFRESFGIAPGHYLRREMIESGLKSEMA